jgi:hypothetical protein
MLARMAEPLPVDAAQGDARHQDMRAEVFDVVPQQRASLSQRIFWRVVLFAAQFPWALRLIKRLRRS